MRFHIEAIYIGEFDIHAGPQVRYLATDNTKFKETILKHFEAWNEFFIPEIELTNKFVRIPIDPEHSVLSYAIEYRNDVYERKKIVFNIGIVVLDLVYKLYRPALKKNMEKLAEYLLKLEKTEFLITEVDKSRLISTINHIYKRLTQDDKVILLQENHLCYLYFDKPNKTFPSINLKKIVLRTKKLDNIEEYYTTSYLQYVILLHLNKETRISYLIEAVFDFLKDKFEHFSKNDFSFSKDADYEIHSSLCSSSDLVAFILEVISQLNESQKLYVVDAIEPKQFYYFPKANINYCHRLSYFKQFTDFLDELSVDINLTEEDIKDTFYFLLEHFDGIHNAAHVLSDLKRYNRSIPTRDIVTIFTYFIYFNTIKEKIIKKKEYYYIDDVDKSEAKKMYFTSEIKNEMNYEVFDSIIKDLFHKIILKDDLLKKYAISEDVFDYFIKRCEIKKIYL